MRQEVQVYVTIKLKGLSQRFEESDEGDRQMGFGVVHYCYYDKIYLQSRSTPVAQSAPRNLLTRWDVSSIPANGIFLTKN